VVVTPDDGLGDRNVGVLERAHHTVLAEDVVGGVGGLTRWGSADDEDALAPLDGQRLVGVSPLVSLDIVGVCRPDLRRQKRPELVYVYQAFEVVVGFCHGALSTANT